MKSFDNVPLKPYYKKFLWVYLITFIVALIIAVVAARYGLQAGSMAIQVAALMAASFYVIQKFAHEQKRFFTKSELNRMVNITTLIAAIFQVFLFALIIGLFEFVKKQLQNPPAGVTINTDQAAILDAYNKILHQPLIILSIVVIMVAISFLIQNLNFRFLGRRMIKKMNLPLP